MAINKDLASGGIFLAIGLYFLIYALTDLRLGSALVMGPGYFPALVGGLLALFGVAILYRGLRSAPTSLGKVSVRGVAMVTLAIIFFGVALRTLGLVPAVFGSVWIAALATSRNSVLQASALALALTVMTAVLFVYLLGLPIPLIGPWLGGY